MKIKIIEDPDLDDDIVIYTKSISPEIERFVDSFNRGAIIAQHREKDIQIQLEEILFFETESDGVIVHMSRDYFPTKYKLYELQELLPSHFMRISKSCIINLELVSGYERSITSSRTIFFINSDKTTFVSRMYYSQFKDQLIKRSL